MTKKQRDRRALVLEQAADILTVLATESSGELTLKVQHGINVGVHTYLFKVAEAVKRVQPE